MNDRDHKMSDCQMHDMARSSALGRYLLLHSQQQEITRRLDSSHSLSPSTFDHHALPHRSNTRRKYNHFNSTNSTISSSSYASPSAPTDTFETEYFQREQGEQEQDPDLLDVVNAIKATLTTLLNLPSVRQDASGELRMWVQSRLMEAEMDSKALRKKSCREGWEREMS